LESTEAVPICVIFNPTAKGNKARRFKGHLDDFAGECAFKPTTGPWTAPQLTAEAIREGFDTIIAAGGDGTVNEVLNGIASVPDGFAKARLGVVPLGTVNVFAKELGLPAKLAKAWDIIRRGRERRIDVPYFDHHSSSNGSNGATAERRCFVQLAGAGLDARAIELVSWKLKKAAGPLAYIVAGFRAWAEPQPPITVRADGRAATGQLVLLGNGRFYGGRIPFFPDASLSDGLLDAHVFERITWGTLMRWGWSAATGRPVSTPGSTLLQSDRMELSAGARVPFEVEGDFAGQLPVTAGVLPQALRVIVP